jgi:hypothetical protein
VSKTFAELPVAEMNAMLTKFKHAGDRAATRALDLATEALVSEAQVDAPVKTGFLKERHFVERVRPLLRLIGVNTTYALAVHETHKTKRRWFVNAVRTNFTRVFEGALKIALREEAGK